MYTIIPLLLAHIQELNKQILFLFKFIVKNIPLNLEKSKDKPLKPILNLVVKILFLMMLTGLLQLFKTTFLHLLETIK